MVFIVYPPEPAPLIGKKIDPREEIFPLVEPNGLVIGRAPRSLCHAGSMLLHPVVNMHIIDRNARLYLQKRSKRKRTYPGCWDTSVGGHVGYGEQLEEALYREAVEELGFYDFHPIFLESFVYENQREKELVALYATISSKSPIPYGTEVSEARWWTFEEIEKAPENKFTPSFINEFKKIKDKLLSLL